MISDKETLDCEKANLDRVVNEIRIQLNKGKDSVSSFKKEAIELQKEMWEDAKCMPTDLFDLEAPTTMWQYQASLANQARKYKFAYDTVGRLERMYQSPYFGRIDFIEDGEDNTEKIYIGIHNLIKNNTTREILVYDWRAPISSMFYDFEIGLSSYNCPAGLIAGQMLLKRQYKIENQNILYMFDSSISINDEMLQEILGKSTDNKMKTIVTSIQREQNTVIRNSQDRVLIVEGPAGSGKTSIALHRAAYILYKYRESINSDNILIFSPNHVFEDYISSVLPELGEEDIRRSTFVDFFSNMLDSKYRIETMNEQMEFILSVNPNKIRLNAIKFKSSLQFLTILKNYVQDLENRMDLGFKDITYNGTLVITADKIYRLFRNDYSLFSYAKRLEKLRQRLFYLLEQCDEKLDEVESLKSDLQDGYSITEEERKIAKQKRMAELEILKNDIIQMTDFDIYMLYKNLFGKIGLLAKNVDDLEGEELENLSIYTSNRLEQGILNYEDITPIIFLKTVLDASSNAKSVKHVIVDEAQDYTAVQYEIFKKVFEHCNMTILGDVNQAINGYMNAGSFENISGVFDKKYTKSISLTKSYRSSKEIADFCKEILVASSYSEQLNRHGNKPKVIKADRSNLYKRIADDVLDLKSRNYKLIAVICKTAGQCNSLYKALKPLMEVSLVSNQNEEYHGDVVVIPSYLAKGLEFDAVIVDSIEDVEYSQEEDRRLLYTVCTRALHELYLYYFDNMSDFIKNIGEDFYTKDTIS